MKTRYFIIAAAAIAALSACQKAENVIPELQQEIIAGRIDPWTFVDHSYLKHPGQPIPSTVTAGFAETKTQIDMNAAGTHAETIWQPGDSFEMILPDYSYEVYTTTAGGAVADFTSTGTLSGTTYHCVYPGCRTCYFDGDYAYLGIEIPAEQTAEAGKVTPGAMVSYAVTTDPDADLHFKNATALVKFRLSGSVVSSLQSVTLKGTSYIAGDLIMLPNGDSPDLFMDASFGGDVKSRSVKLSGTFKEGEDYYIAIAPGTQPVISMIFSDGTDTETKTSSNSITFTRSHITDLGTIDLGDKLEEPAGLAPVQYCAATKGTKPVTIAIVPEAFTEAEMDDYVALATSALNLLFSTEPYKTYKEYFNVWILKVPSKESGATITDGNHNVKTARDTYFEAAWGESSYGDMSANDDKVFAFVEDHCPDIIDGSHTLEEVPIAMIINDERYGGICWSWGSGRCIAMVPYTGSGSSMGWGYASVIAVDDSDPSAGTRAVTSADIAELGTNYGDWRNTFIHEFGGHGFGRLGDEYWYDSDQGPVTSIAQHSWSVPFALNISATYDNTPWKAALLDNKTTLVSINPLYDRIGVYQGGQMSTLNRWRSEKISCMIDNRCYYSTWQRVLIVNRILTLAGETFSLNDFVANDSPIDPIRDVASSPVMGQNSRMPVRMMPPLAPPVLIDE